MIASCSSGFSLASAPRSAPALPSRWRARPETRHHPAFPLSRSVRSAPPPPAPQLVANPVEDGLPEGARCSDPTPRTSKSSILLNVWRSASWTTSSVLGENRGRSAAAGLWPSAARGGLWRANSLLSAPTRSPPLASATSSAVLARSVRGVARIDRGAESESSLMVTMSPDRLLRRSLADELRKGGFDMNVSFDVSGHPRRCRRPILILRDYAGEQLVGR